MLGLITKYTVMWGGNIACYVKWMYDGIFSYCGNTVTQENIPTQGQYLVDAELWNVSFFLCNTTIRYNELNRRGVLGYQPAITTGSLDLQPNNYPWVLGTGNENTTKYGMSKSKRQGANWLDTCHKSYRRDPFFGMEVRGFIVGKNKKLKESKSRIAQIRAHSTLRENSNAAQTLSPEGKEENLSLAFEKIAKLWIANYNDHDKVYKNLKGIMNMKEIWYASYVKVRASKGSETPGVDLQTLDGTTKGKLDQLRDKVMKREFQWSNIKRVMIPKGNGKTRPLGIPTLEDRIVQDVLKTILEPIYDPTFSKYSHGFRPGRSCHTALKYINTHFKQVSWVIEGDITQYFPTINHNILMHILRRKIKDNLILDLIEKGLKANIMEKREVRENLSGTPQGGILSPLLSNIYLDDFDNFMEELIIKYKGPKKSARVNPLYTRLMSNQSKEYDPKLFRRLKASRTDPFDKGFQHIRYIRYADDFVVGVAGSQLLAVEIREKIRNHMKEHRALELHMEKTKITSIAQGIPFLGYIIGRKTIITERKRYGKVTPLRAVFPTLDANINKMVKNLAASGFCDNSGKSKPNFSLLVLPQSEINSRINSILRGIANWWSIAGNRKRAIARISYILSYSTAKLYAAKFKLDSIAQVFKKGGKDLSKPLSAHKRAVIGITDERIEKWSKSDKSCDQANDTKRQIQPILYTSYHRIPGPTGNKLTENWTPDFERELSTENGIKNLIDRMQKGELTSKEKNPLSLAGWRMSKGIRVLDEPCLICGSTVNIEMHHVKSLKLLKPLKDMLKDKERAITRKQVPLCRTHHLQAHNYNWRNPAMNIKKLIQKQGDIKTDWMKEKG
uniref:Reverse transcriptase domain domain X n=1 Tax=Chrysoporthe austroafricana TaxID=354353 RepID=A0A191MWT9_9PEZI|nr:reverse transcriptase domain; domain X [Chrysoporthe austroafricana]AMX22122.1 reverse transcriptase domain; domain X [Chrysoporthe austroafricana]